MQYVKRGVELQGAIVRCTRKSCRQVIVRMDVDEYRRYARGNTYELRCLACKGRCEASEIYGRYIAEMVCGSKCTGAVGPSCDCSCAGKNHGGKYAA